MSGYLITFEGGEGVGKSTQIQHLARRLRELGHAVITTREPGGTRMSEAVRSILKDSAHNQMAPEAELLLFLASRAQLVREVIQPALACGTIVLCDRFTDSTTVYQGLARHLALDSVRMLCHFAAPIQPDLTLILDLPASVGFQRIQTRCQEPGDRMEQEPESFYEAVRKGYQVLAQSGEPRFALIDAALPELEVSDSIWLIVKRKLKL